ncbi:MAG: HD domain-containing protein [Prevotella sp.]|nr:HD domain-containing protein [Prevotella sp.]
MSNGKIINDPVFGFIKIPGGVLMDIVDHPLMQRLRHIKQLGLASIVYPGAQHTRFQHSLGAYWLMNEAVMTLAQKGIFIFDSEAEAIKAAILMHDIGHGPYSHVLEHTLLNGVSHEDVSLMMMEQINRENGGCLNLALNIFRNQYPKRFLHQLISSQLDMDRLDYLRRDSFFTGVSEGNIGSARIIKMLNVVDDKLVVDSKGIYSIENYLISRRLMYWQVYLHKTTVATEKMLVNLLLRAKWLFQQGKQLFATPSLRYFLVNNVDADFFLNHPEALQQYGLLDDADIHCSIKEWTKDNDKVLSLLARNMVSRQTFKVEIHEQPISEERIQMLEDTLMQETGVNRDEVKYLYDISTIQKDMYDLDDDHITILYKDGSMKDITEASEILNVSLLSKKIRKYYLCYHR